MKIKSFLQACKKLGLNPRRCLPGVSRMRQRDRASILAMAKLVIITEALNDGWVPNWNDSNEAKYFPWFYMNDPAFRLCDIVCNWTGSSAGSGSRLCFKSQELAEYAAKQFLKEYEAMMCLPKPPVRRIRKK